jgi:hypothetical protein
LEIFIDLGVAVVAGPEEPISEDSIRHADKDVQGSTFVLFGEREVSFNRTR